MFCLCGCGESTRVASRNMVKTHMVKGQPMRYVHGHNAGRRGLHVKTTPWYTVQSDGCWIWSRVKDRTGYGRYGCLGKSYAAHRVIYEGTKGPIPSGLVLDHLCGTRACVNPDHMEPVSHGENLKRGGYAHASSS